MTKVLVVDNYDSFVFNLVQYVAELGAEPVVVRHDVVPADEAGARALLDEHRPDGVLISPGPGTPESAGVSMPLVAVAAERDLPLFGVCLGHQAIAAAFGAVVGPAPELLHGKTSQVQHDGTGVLSGLPQPFTATRYHSLAVDRDTLPAELVVTGATESGVVMALRHTSRPIEGVQFHPESVLTEGGHRIVANWLRTLGPGSSGHGTLGHAATDAEADALDDSLREVRALAKFSLT